MSEIERFSNTIKKLREDEDEKQKRLLEGIKAVHAKRQEQTGKPYRRE